MIQEILQISNRINTRKKEKEILVSENKKTKRKNVKAAERKINPLPSKEQ